MTDFLVGARFDVKSNELVAAAKANAEQLERLKQAAAEAGREVDGLVNAQGKITREGKAALKTLEDTEKKLGDYLAKIDPVARAIKTRTEGEIRLKQALDLGLIGQKEYEAGIAKVTKEYDRQRITSDALIKGKLSLGDTMKLASRELGVLAGSLAGTIAGLAGAAIGTAALSAVMALLPPIVDDLTRAEGELAEVLKKSGDEVDKEKQSAATRLANARAIAEAKRNEARAILTKIEAMRAEAIAQATIEAGMAAGNITPEIAADIARRAGDPFDAATARARAAMAIDYYTKQPYDDALIRRLRTDDNEREAERERLDREYKRRFNPDPKTGSTARRGPSEGERDLLRQAEAAIKARRALDEYGEASQDIIEKAQAEFSGRRELIAQIELEAQLRKQYGVEFVAQNKDRITALAAERAAAQQLSDQYKATARFLESSADRLGDVLDATLVLSWDRSAESVKRWEDTLVNSLRQVAAELQRLAIVNPIINAISGNNRLPTAYGQGGIADVLLGWLGLAGGGSVNMNAGVGHGGGKVGALPASRWVPDIVFRAAPRAHEGLQLGARERPVIAMEGEGIFTPRAMNNADNIVRALAAIAARGLGGDEDLTIQLIDQRGSDARPMRANARRSRGAGGDRQLKLYITEAAREGMREGAFDGPMSERYGVANKGAK